LPLGYAEDANPVTKNRLPLTQLVMQERWKA